MTKSDYAQLRRNPQWQKKRLEILERDEFECYCCGSESKELHVHHRYYIQNRKPWEYPDWSMLTLCSDCHSLYGDSENSAENWEDFLEHLSGGNPAFLDISCEVFDTARCDHQIPGGKLRQLFRDFVLSLKNEPAV